MTSLPAELIRPIVQRYLDEYEVEDGDGYKMRGFKQSPLVILASEAGIAERRMRRFISGENKTIDFDMADRLLCAMGLVFLWYAKPLSEYYWTLDLGEPDPNSPDITPGETFGCGHERTLENCKPDPFVSKGSRKIYWRCRTCWNARARRRKAAA